MVSIRSLETSCISFLLLLGSTSASARYAHLPNEVHRRQSDIRPYNGPPGATTSTLKQVLTFVTPSPGATPVAVTTQSQIVTSYVPQFTLCELPPVAQVFATPIPTTTTAPYKNYTVSIPTGNGTCKTIFSSTITMVCATVLTGLAQKFTVTACDQEIPFSTNYGYAIVTGTPTVSLVSISAANSSMAGPSASAVSSSLSPSAHGNPVSLVSAPSLLSKSSLILATAGLSTSSSGSAATLSTSTAIPLTSSLIASTSGTGLSIQVVASVSVAASLPSSASLAPGLPGLLPTHLNRRDVITTTITPAPSIQTLTTTYLAPWQQLRSGGTSPSDITQKVCTTFANGTRECILEFYEWLTTLSTITATTTTSVNLTTTISGPSQIIVETLVANVTEVMTTFKLVTSMALEYETVAEMTSSVTRTSPTPGAQSTGPTVYETFTLLQASQTGSSLLPTSTSTTTLKLTKTVFVPGTTTITQSDAIKTLPAGVTSLDTASALGVGSR